MFLFAKDIRNIGTISQPQLMSQRYNSTVSLLLTIFIIIFMVIASAVQVIVIDRFFHAFFNMSYEAETILGTVIVLTIPYLVVLEALYSPIYYSSYSSY